MAVSLYFTDSSFSTQTVRLREMERESEGEKEREKESKEKELLHIYNNYHHLHNSRHRMCRTETPHAMLSQHVYYHIDRILLIKRF